MVKPCVERVMGTIAFPPPGGEGVITLKKDVVFKPPATVRPNCSDAKYQTTSSSRSLLSWADGYLRMAEEPGAGGRGHCAKAITMGIQAYCKDKSARPTFDDIWTRCRKRGYLNP